MRKLSEHSCNINSTERNLKSIKHNKNIYDIFISSLTCGHFNLLFAESILINFPSDIFLGAKFFILKWRKLEKEISNQYCFTTMYTIIAFMHSNSVFNFAPNMNDRPQSSI